MNVSDKPGAGEPKCWSAGCDRYGNIKSERYGGYLCATHAAQGPVRKRFRLMLWAGTTTSGLSSLHAENDQCASNPCPDDDVHGTRCEYSGFDAVWTGDAAEEPMTEVPANEVSRRNAVRGLRMARAELSRAGGDGMSRFIVLDGYVANIDYIVYFVDANTDNTPYVIVKMRDGTTLTSTGETIIQLKARIDARLEGTE